MYEILCATRCKSILLLLLFNFLLISVCGFLFKPSFLVTPSQGYEYKTVHNRITSLLILTERNVNHHKEIYDVQEKPGKWKYTVGDIKLLDHLNINHEKGRHDLVKAFYFETLKLKPDPRKQENMDKGK